MIYCESLTLLSCIKAIQIRRRDRSTSDSSDIRVLDPLTRWSPQTAMRLVMSILGFRVREARFYAGNLRTQGGESVAIAARREAQQIASKAAQLLLDRWPYLADLNRAWGRDTVQLHLAKRFLEPAERSALRVMVTSALARDAGVERPILILWRRPPVDPELLADLCPEVQLHTYRLVFGPLRATRTFLLVWLGRQMLLRSYWHLAFGLAKIARRSNSPLALQSNGPAILMPQEDDLSTDRSHRTQPHWLFPEEGTLQFQTLVLMNGGAAVRRMPVDAQDLKKRGIVPVSPEQAALFPGRRPLHPVQRRLRRDFWTCIFRCVFSFSANRGIAASQLVRLFFVARRLADLCRATNTRLFMTCENAFREPDAIQLFAPELGIHTLSYQFANAGIVGPGMQTNADTMFTFSPLYQDRYTSNGVRPQSIVNIGYLFDTSFELVRERALESRLKLQAAGAEFVICYFDEGMQPNKYGVISPEDRRDELLALLRLVLDDPSIGLVVKTKYHWNSPSSFDALKPAVDQAMATGRYLELSRGAHRNIVLPAEAAMMADMTIGQAIGGTTALESALAGTRSILVNPYGTSNVNHCLYQQADILYPSMDSALKAIQAFREGSPDHQGLGDWSGIISQFDPYRDGQAARRMASYIRYLFEALGDGASSEAAGAAAATRLAGEWEQQPLSAAGRK